MQNTFQRHRFTIETPQGIVEVIEHYGYKPVFWEFVGPNGYHVFVNDRQEMNALADRIHSLNISHNCGAV